MFQRGSEQTDSAVFKNESNLKFSFKKLDLPYKANGLSLVLV